MGNNHGTFVGQALVLLLVSPFVFIASLLHWAFVLLYHPHHEPPRCIAITGASSGIGAALARLYSKPFAF